MKTKIIKKFFPRAWEPIDSDGTNRLQIYGGWLIWSSYNEDSESMTFVPDPDHKWRLVPIENGQKEENQEIKEKEEE